MVHIDTPDDVYCSADFADIAARLDLRSADGDLADAPETVTRASLAANAVLATHFRNWSGGGESLNVVGSDCNGGGISYNAGDYWNDAFYSTRHGVCGRIKHFSDAGYSGDLDETTGPLSNLVNTGGRVSSISYH